MRKKRKLSVGLLAFLIFAFLLLGCSTSGTEEETESAAVDSGTETAEEETESAAADETAEDLYGKVTYVGTSYISVTVCAPDETGAAAAAENGGWADPAALVETGETESVNTDDSTEYYRLENGALVSVEREAVEKGQLIVVTSSSEGVLQIIILADADAADGEAAWQIQAADATDFEVDGTAADSEADETAVDLEAADPETAAAEETEEQQTEPDEA